MTTEVLYFQAVFLLYLFQDYVDSLNREDRAFLTYLDGSSLNTQKSIALNLHNQRKILILQKIYENDLRYGC